MKLESIRFDGQFDKFIAKYACTRCGNEVEEIDNFCKQCGHEIKKLNMKQSIDFDYGLMCGLVAHAIIDGTIERIARGCSCRYEYPTKGGMVFANWTLKREEGIEE